MGFHGIVRLSFLALLAALLLAAPGPLYAVGDNERCEGTVVDDQGQPLAGVTVSFMDLATNRMAQSIKTSKKGKYAHNVLRANTNPGWEIRATLDGYKIVQITALTISSGGDRITDETYMVGLDQEGLHAVRVPAQARGDVASRGKCVVDFILAPEDRFNQAFHKLREARGGEPADATAEGGAVEGAPGAAPAAEAPPPPVATPYDIGLARVRDGDYAGAIEPFRQAVEENPDDAMAHRWLGGSLLKTDKLTEAEPELKKALTLDPDIQGLNFDMGMVYIKRERLMQAIPYFEKERELTPDSTALLQNLGKLYVDTEQYDKAVPIFEHLIELEPQSIEYYGSLAAVYKEMGDPAKELEVYQRMGDQDKSGMAFYNLGNIMFNKNEMQKAADAYIKAITVAPDNAGAHYQLGLTYVNLAKFKEAVAELEKFIELKPKDPKAAEAKSLAADLKKING